MDKHICYLKGFQQTLNAFLNLPCPRYIYQRQAFYGVRFMNGFTRSETVPENLIEELNEAELEMYNHILNVIEQLTPFELTQVFPIDKYYKGEKYGMKDYFYTRDILSKLPADRPIGDTMQGFDLLWDYLNRELREFLVGYMGALSDARRLEGKPSLAESFCAENNIPMYRKHTDTQGKEFLVDSQTGRTVRIKEPMPKYLRVVK